MSSFTHVKPEGGVHMVDVSAKSDSIRTAIAVGKVILGEEAFNRVKDNTLRKGDVLSVAQIAGIMGAKETSRLIPLCHTVQIQRVDVELTLLESESAIEIRSFVKSIGPTGVEMEALTAVSIAALTVYDMCKAITKDITIDQIHLLAKTGGASGDYRKQDIA
ncbi:MAG: cyclic pyranopterin monophosphate synthase MoaC [Bacteroidetes bacterium]|nr:cyclic pyranopterin monophosphate synthase MoaC [Bacteroidota bacterium]